MSDISVEVDTKMVHCSEGTLKMVVDKIGDLNLNVSMDSVEGLQDESAEVKAWRISGTTRNFLPIDHEHLFMFSSYGCYIVLFIYASGRKGIYYTWHGANTEERKREAVEKKSSDFILEEYVGLEVISAKVVQGFEPVFLKYLIKRATALPMTIMNAPEEKLTSKNYPMLLISLTLEEFIPATSAWMTRFDITDRQLCLGKRDAAQCVQGPIDELTLEEDQLKILAKKQVFFKDEEILTLTTPPPLSARVLVLITPRNITTGKSRINIYYMICAHASKTVADATEKLVDWLMNTKTQGSISSQTTGGGRGGGTERLRRGLAGASFASNPSASSRVSKRGLMSKKSTFRLGGGDDVDATTLTFDTFKLHQKASAPEVSIGCELTRPRRLFRISYESFLAKRGYIMEVGQGGLFSIQDLLQYPRDCFLLDTGRSMNSSSIFLWAGPDTSYHSMALAIRICRDYRDVLQKKPLLQSIVVGKAANGRASITSLAVVTEVEFTLEWSGRETIAFKLCIPDWANRTREAIDDIAIDPLTLSDDARDDAKFNEVGTLISTGKAKKASQLLATPKETVTVKESKSSSAGNSPTLSPNAAPRRSWTKDMAGTGTASAAGSAAGSDKEKSRLPTTRQKSDASSTTSSSAAASAGKKSARGKSVDTAEDPDVLILTGDGGSGRSPSPAPPHTRVKGGGEKTCSSRLSNLDILCCFYSEDIEDEFEEYEDYMAAKRKSVTAANNNKPVDTSTSSDKTGEKKGKGAGLSKIITKDLPSPGRGSASGPSPARGSETGPSPRLSKEAKQGLRQIYVSKRGLLDDETSPTDSRTPGSALSPTASAMRKVDADNGHGAGGGGGGSGRATNTVPATKKLSGAAATASASASGGTNIAVEHKDSGSSLGTHNSLTSMPVTSKGSLTPRGLSWSIVEATLYEMESAMKSCVLNPNILMGWRVQLTAMKRNFYVTNVRKLKWGSSTEFQLESEGGGNKEWMWTALKRHKRKSGLEFTLLSKIE